MTAVSPLSDALAPPQPPVVLDGGLSNALADLGHDLSDSLWTARLLRDDPAAIAVVHRAYFAAGAQVATTASYQASVAGFEAGGLTRRAAQELIVESVRIARDVRDELDSDGVDRWVAASIGPYGAVLADGSEYRGRYGVSAAQLRDFHGSRLELLVGAAPDVLAVETIPDVAEAEVLVGLLDEFDVPAWFSFAAHGSSTRAGQPLPEAFSVASSSRQVCAVGVNCCTPEDVLPALQLALDVTGLPAVAYPNSGERWDERHRCWLGSPSYDVQLAQQWTAAGARLVGGCCRIGPHTIASLAATVRSQQTA